VFSKREAAITAGTLLLVAGGWWVIRYRAETAERAKPALVGFVQFENLTGDSGRDWLRAAIAESLARQLAGARDVRVTIARNPGEASASGATHLLFGHVERGPRGFSLQFTLESAKRKSSIASWDRTLPDGKWTGELRAAAGQILEELRAGSSIAPMEIHNDNALAAFGAGNYSACAAADPLAGWCWKEWAESELRAGRPLEAEKVLSQSAARQLTPQSRAQLDFMRAQLKRDRNLENASLAALTKLFPAEPTYGAALATRLTRLRQFDQAIAAWRSVVRSSPDYADAWNQLGYAYAWAGNFEEARKAIAEYELLQSGSPNPPDSRGEIEYTAGRFEAAEKAFLASHDKNPNFNGGAALEKAALCRYLSGNPQGAADLLNRFFKQRESAGDASVELRRAKWDYMFGMGPAAKARLTRAAESSEPALSQPATLYLAMWSAWENGSAVAYRQPASLFSGLPEPVARAWSAALASSDPGEDAISREIRALADPKTGDRSRWPLLTPQQALLFDWLVFPNTFYWRAESALAANKSAEARRFFELYLQYSEKRSDHPDQVKRAREASRL
jgi:Flp pilus assembly protein TadD